MVAVPAVLLLRKLRQDGHLRAGIKDKPGQHRGPPHLKKENQQRKQAIEL
jgi:hypothetical protein